MMPAVKAMQVLVVLSDDGVGDDDDSDDDTSEDVLDFMTGTHSG